MVDSVLWLFAVAILLYLLKNRTQFCQRFWPLLVCGFETIPELLAVMEEFQCIHLKSDSAFLTGL